MQNKLYKDAIILLRSLISTQSLSGCEDHAADVLQSYLRKNSVNSHRYLNNIWAFNQKYDLRKPSILLNSHIDTVKPNSGYTIDPYQPLEVDGKLFGLGSNDAGGSLVSLVATFLYFNEKPNLKYNLILAITAEEENSGKNGLSCVLPKIPKFEFAIVGEPTSMQLAIAEKGLIVLDCLALGESGHAARNEGINAIAMAVEDINWFNTYQFPKVSKFLGPVKMTVTIINGGTQHNVIPDKCTFTVDVRVNECYTNEQVLEIIRLNVKSTVTPRSTNLRSSSIDVKHPIVLSGISLGRKIYGSPTTSDQVKITTPSLKLGPGDSGRSHTANEFIYLKEIEEGINIYIETLKKVIEK